MIVLMSVYINAQRLREYAGRIRNTKFTYADTCDFSDYLNDLHVAVEQLEYPKYSFRYMFAMRRYIERSLRAVVVARLYLLENGCPAERLAEYDTCLEYILTNCPR